MMLPEPKHTFTVASELLVQFNGDFLLERAVREGIHTGLNRVLGEEPTEVRSRLDEALFTEIMGALDEIMSFVPPPAPPYVAFSNN